MPLVNGVWRYDESDIVTATFSDLLNLLSDSARTAITALAPANPTNLTLTAAWTGYQSATYGVPYIRRTGHQRRLGGLVQPVGAAPGDNAIITTLAVGDRPDRTMYALAAQTNTVCGITVAADGTVRWRSHGAAPTTAQWVSLNDVIYEAV